MAKKTAPVEKTQGGARTAFTDEQIGHIKSKILELIPQGWTIRQALAEPDMCSISVLSAASVRVSVRPSATLDDLEAVIRKHCSCNFSQPLERLRGMADLNLIDLGAAVTEGVAALARKYGFSQNASRAAAPRSPWRSRSARSRLRQC